MKYVDYDSSGKILAFYDEEIHGAREIDDADGGGPNPDSLVPATAVPITDDEWRAVLAAQGEWRIAPVTQTLERVPPPSPAEILARARAARLSYLRQRRDEAIERGVTFAGRRYYSDKQSISDALQAVFGLQMVAAMSPAEKAALPGPAPTTVTWKLAERAGGLSHAELTLTELKYLFAAMSKHQQDQYALEAGLMGAVEAATTPEAVTAVDWPT
jgi:Domain of unknown function (DUF4376)